MFVMRCAAFRQLIQLKLIEAHSKSGGGTWGAGGMDGRQWALNFAGAHFTFISTQSKCVEYPGIRASAIVDWRMGIGDWGQGTGEWGTGKTEAQKFQFHFIYERPGDTFECK